MHIFANPVTYASGGTMIVRIEAHPNFYAVYVNLYGEIKAEVFFDETKKISASLRNQRLL